MAIQVRQISPSRRELKRFVNFQLDLYKGNSCFVPPLISDDVNTLDPQKNPAYDFCESALFMAYDESGRPVGRIAGIINRQVNEKLSQRQVRFGFIDFIDDPEVCRLLLEAVEKWGRSKGMNKIVGPLGFSDLDYEGTLVEGFDEMSTMATIYNYPYYGPYIEQAGYSKESDWVEFRIAVPDKMPDRYIRVADIVSQKLGLRVIKYKSRSKIKADYGRAIFELVNDAYKDLYEYSPLTDRQIDHYINIYLGLLNLDLVSLVVDADDNLVGVGIALPSMSEGLRRSGGRMLPFGWYHLLKGLKGKNDVVDLLLVAIRPDLQSKGANALIFRDLIPQFQKYGFKFAESNPEMESNDKVQNQWSIFNPRQHKRRRSFAKQL